MEDNQLTFDPMAWASQNNVNTVVNEQNAKAAQVSNPTTADCGDELAKAQATADELLRMGANIAETYDEYLHLGMALANGLGEQGRDIYHQLCAQSSKYRQTDCEKKWQECLKKNDGRITIASFYKMAQDAGVDLSAIGRQFPSKPQNPHHEGNLGKYGNSGISENSLISPHPEGDEGSEGNSMEMTADNEDNSGGYSETFSDKIKLSTLPPLLREVAETQPDAESKDKMLLGSLTCLSGAMPNVYGVYDKRKVLSPFYSIIDAPASADKGMLNACQRLLEPIEKDIEHQSELEQAEFQRELAEYMAKDRSTRASTPAPKEPPFRSLWIPANSSATACYQALADNHDWGVTFESEADTLTVSLKSDYGDFSDGLRKAFHHEMITYNRRKDNEHVKIYRPRWAILLTCTPGQIPTLFPSLENGLGSRFVFYNLRRRLFWRDVFEKSDKTLDEQFLELGNRYKTIYDELLQHKEHPLEFLFSDEQRKDFNLFFEGLQLEQVGLYGDDLIAFVRRLGLVCFRIAMILTVLRHEGGQPMFNPLSQSLVCTDEDFQTAKTIVNCLINHTAHVYTNLVKHDDTTLHGGSQRMSAQEQLLYKALATDFTTNDCRSAAQQLNIPWKTAERYLGSFVSKYHTVRRIRNGQYRKN
jgi:hypothetical protein